MESVSCHPVEKGDSEDRTMKHPPRRAARIAVALAFLLTPRHSVQTAASEPTVLIADGAGKHDSPPATRLLKEMLEINLKKKEDQLSLRGNSRSATLSITSPSGIGGATIRRIATDWPGQVVLQLNLRGLEQLSIQNVDANVTLRASVRSHGDHRRSLQVLTGDPQSPVTPDSPYFTKIRAFDRERNETHTFPLEQGYFQLTIPAAMLKDNPTQLSIQWIDFSRS